MGIIIQIKKMHSYWLTVGVTKCPEETFETLYAEILNFFLSFFPIEAIIKISSADQNWEKDLLAETKLD